MKKRILVVEDEDKLRRVLELQLVSAGFDVDKAASAEEGIKVVDRADLVLTDLKLPNMDGLQLLPLLRRQNAQVPNMDGLQLLALIRRQNAQVPLVICV